MPLIQAKLIFCRVTFWLPSLKLGENLIRIHTLWCDAAVGTREDAGFANRKMLVAATVAR